MKTVLITGSSRGIGAAIAAEFASRGGFNIIINCRKSSSDLENLQQKLNSYPDTTCTASLGDISDETYVSGLFDIIKEHFCGIDILINNAGIDLYALTQDMTLEEWNRIIGVNLTAPFLCCKYAIPQMLGKPECSILNISSVWGETGAALESAYSASKGGLNAFTKSLAKELGPSNIRVNALSCGYIDTRMNDCLSAEDTEAIKNDTPLGRVGNTSEIAAAACDIVCGFSFMTGQIVTLDGGWIMP